MSVLVNPKDKPEGVGKLSWEKVEILWAVYTQRAWRRTAAESEVIGRPIRIIARFEDGEATGEFFMDAIAFARLDNDAWEKKLVELAKQTIESGRRAQGMH